VPAAERPDAVVVGSGPNGLAAAITLAQAGHSVVVREAESSLGGGTRSEALTLPGFVHDVCAAVVPLAVGSPFFRSIPFDRYGVTFVHPTIPLAHPFDDGSAAVLLRSVEETATALGPDARAYRGLMSPVVDDWEALIGVVLGPLRPTRHLLTLARFGLVGVRSARGLATSTFAGERARALFGGLALHAILPLERPPSAAFGLVLAVLGHAVGWPVVRGGSQQVADALAARLQSLGGAVITNARVESIDDVLPARKVLLDLTPRQILKIAGHRLPPGYRSQLQRYRYGPGVYKVDWALDGPVPWRAPECRVAGTVHVGGTLDELVASERAVWRGEVPDRPAVLVTQPSLFDPTRAPAGKHTLWAYCHVPHGSTVDAVARIEAQIERFAPGFRDQILARSIMPPAALERHNANCIGGDINGGVEDFQQLWTRPTARLNPYSTPAPGVFICSSSTPPGGGVHGMCGYWAARAALNR
jgi:phytoene dehydrogenase-like protein